MDCGFWLGWQIDYLLYLQSFRDISCHVFDKFFIYITMFGEVMIPIIVICILYWAIDKKVGQFVLWSYVFGYLANLIAKTTACIYRPWILDSRVKPLAEAIPAATGYSFPSGHTTGALATWGSIAVSYWNNKILRYLCLGIVVCVMISRNYLGVHTPQDVIVGFLLTAIMIWITNNIINWTEKNKNRDIIIVFAVFLITILALLYVNFKYYPVDYLFGKILYDPTFDKIQAIIRSGFIFGAFIGWLLERRFIGFEPKTGSITNKILRVIFGLVCLIFIYNSVGFFISMFGSIFGKQIHYFILGLFITLFYPILIKLTESRH